MNSVKLIGNVGRDIQVKDFDGGKMIHFSLATNESYIKKNKEEVKNTEWHSIIAWGAVAKQCEKLLEKGKKVSVEGKLTYSQFVNKENITVKVVRVQAFKVEEVVHPLEPRNG